MNRIEAYQNAFFCMTMLITKNVGTIHTLDVFPSSVALSVHLPDPAFVVDDVVSLIKPYLLGSPDIKVNTIAGTSVNVLHIDWDAYDE